MSGLRCWPGAAAIVTGYGGTGIAREVSRACLGRTVRCVRLRRPAGIAECTADLVWEFEEPMEVKVGMYTATITGAADDILTPLTPPPGTDTETVEDVLDAARIAPVEV